MNSKIEVADKTVNGAIEKGLEELGIKRDNAEIEVIAEPGAGIFGIGAKSARVIVSMKKDPITYLQQFMSDLLERMNVQGEIKVNQSGDSIYVDVAGKDVGSLIGRRGQTLYALQYLMNTALHRQFVLFAGRALLDVGNYRKEREETLRQLAWKMAEKALETGREIFLEPMVASERRIIHLALQEKEGIKTSSQGEDPLRKIVISPE